VHRPGRITPLLVALAVGAVMVPAVVAVWRSAAPPAPAAGDLPVQAGTVKSFTNLFDEAQVQAMTRAQLATIARGNAVVVLNSWDFRLIPVLKRANPSVQVWVYKDLSGVRSDDCTTSTGNCGACGPGVADNRLLSSGIGYCWLKRNHPDWLLRALGSGRPFQFRGYPHTWETDYGNRAYQRQWAANVIADVHSHGWDGVELDNALAIADAYGVAARYRSNAAVQAATYSALQEVGHALSRADVALVANVGYATRFRGLWQRWLGPVGGLEQEFYLSFTTQPDAVGDGWGEYESEVSSCAAQHKRCWFHTGRYTAAVTTQTRSYALASLLLATDGRQLLSVGDLTSLPSALRVALGFSLSTMDQAGRAWRRSFAGGVAVVNPTRSSTVAYLGGSYFGNAGHTVSAVFLQPASAAVLRVSAGRQRR
jgi:Hypothetical glycosyl hydrolase family 15